MADRSTIDLSQLDHAIRDLDTLGVKMRANGERAFWKFWAWWSHRRRKRWMEITVEGGEFFGKYWKRLEDQYTRKLDGQVVPAWGGVPRMQAQFVNTRKKIGLGWHRDKKTGKLVQNTRFGGNVQGRLRPSGGRIKQSSIMMKDTGNMRNSIYQEPLAVTRNYIHVGPSGVSEEYAKYQDEVRPVCFWQEPGDSQRAILEQKKEIEIAIREFANG